MSDQHTVTVGFDKKSLKTFEALIENFGKVQQLLEMNGNLLRELGRIGIENQGGSAT